MRRIIKGFLCALCLIFINSSGFANDVATSKSPIVNIKYIHDLIEQEWAVRIPYNPELKNPLVAANMKYLLTAVDSANSYLGTKSQYGESEYATNRAASVNVSVDAVRNLVVLSRHYFTVTTTSDTADFNFRITAAGKFFVDWGDGQIENVTKYDTGTAKTIAHTYAAPGVYEIRIGGAATAYAASNGRNNSISFESNEKLAGVSGSIGQVFPNIGTDMPVFYRLFHGCSNFQGSIPKELFVGVNGAPVKGMFQDVFNHCINLTGEIPPDLFAGIRGAPAESMFRSTFANCLNLRGTIPGTLFSGIVGAPAPYMFRYTFASSGKFTKIGTGLFSGISGAPAADMYLGTFYNNYSLRGEIPVGLFGNISGPMASHMFDTTFYRCRNLTGPSARNPDGVPLYQQFPNATATQVSLMYSGAEKLSDYADIPEAWR